MTGPPRGAVAPSEQRSEVIGFSGELDLSSAPTLSRLRRAVRVQPCPHLLVDLTKVTFIDSFALDEFSRAQQRAEVAGGSVTFHGLAPSVRRVFLATDAGRRLLGPDGDRDPGPPDKAA